MKNILILGGGFGGVYTAHYLLKQLEDVKVTLVNRTNYFLFAPMLHEAATGNLKIDNIVQPIREILHKPNFAFVKGNVEWKRGR
ncbi:FAD-dependent oxidoreductase [Nanoarchaeota archaeon]